MMSLHSLDLHRDLRVRRCVVAVWDVRCLALAIEQIKYLQCREAHVTRLLLPAVVILHNAPVSVVPRPAHARAPGR